MSRFSRSFLESANRKQLTRFLEARGQEVYRAESIKEMREAALYLFECGIPDESPDLQTYAAE